MGFYVRLFRKCWKVCHARNGFTRWKWSAEKLNQSCKRFLICCGEIKTIVNSLYLPEHLVRNTASALGTSIRRAYNRLLLLADSFWLFIMDTYCWSQKCPSWRVDCSPLHTVDTHWFCYKKGGESWGSTCEKSWVSVQNYWVSVQKTTSPKIRPLCNQTVYLKTDSKTLYYSILKLKYSP